MDTVKIRTFLPALRAATLGIIRHGEATVTPSEEEWQVTPPELRTHLVDRYLVGTYGSPLTVEAPGWGAVLTAGEISRQKAEDEARKRAEDEEKKREVFRTKVARALATTTTADLRLFDYETLNEPEVQAHQRALRVAELRAMGPFQAYLATDGLRVTDTPEEIAVWVRECWGEVVAEGTRRAMAHGGHPKSHPHELDKAVEATPAWAEFLAEKQRKEEVKAAKRRERQARETAALRAWGEARRAVEGVEYALERGYDLGELLIEHVTATLRGLGEVEVYRESTDEYDAISWERRARPRADMIRLADLTERTLTTVGLPVHTGREGEEIEGDLYLDMIGVCRVEEDERKSTRIVVRLVSPASGDVAWTVVESYDSAQ